MECVMWRAPRLVQLKVQLKLRTLPVVLFCVAADVVLGRVVGLLGHDVELTVDMFNADVITKMDKSFDFE